MKCVILVIKDMLHQTITTKQNLELAYFCEKVTLSQTYNKLAPVSLA